MAPIRRYLRITKYSVLEVRIYLDNPALASSWLLNPRFSILPRVIEAVRPLVLPKLREENDRDRGKSKGKGKARKKGVKDVVVEDDFEVSIFLTETSTRHSILTKQKFFREDGNSKGKVRQGFGDLTGIGSTGDVPIEVEEEPVIRQEDSEEEVALRDLSVVDSEDDDSDDDAFERTTRLKRPREGQTIEDGEDDGELFVDNFDSTPPQKRMKETSAPEADDEDDKKKMAMNTSYDGFSIYGRVLCLIVKKRETGKARQAAISGGQAMMEEWITSTQKPPDDEDGP